LAALAKAADRCPVITGPMAGDAAPDNADFLAAASALADFARGEDIGARSMGALKPMTDRKGRSLFALLPLIGHEAALARLASPG